GYRTPVHAGAPPRPRRAPAVPAARARAGPARRRARRPRG
ncbi:MAG: hypothetical protein AVDCRST_MAG35-1282, partial [uncultured Quadrisphaera sp.]